MLAADRSVLEVNLRQSAIKLREKELNLYLNTFNAMATQAAVLAGFTTTCIIELTIPENCPKLPLALLHISGVCSICSNLTCISLATMICVVGSGKALKGKHGSMDDAVNGMARERALIYQTFRIGLIGNMASVLAACCIKMDAPIAAVAATIVFFIGVAIEFNSARIQRKFGTVFERRVLLEDLTNYPISNVSGVLSE